MKVIAKTVRELSKNVVVGFFEGKQTKIGIKKIDDSIKKIFNEKLFKGKGDEVYIARYDGGHLILFGFGEEKKFNLDIIRAIGTKMTNYAFIDSYDFLVQKIERFSTGELVQAFVEGVFLGSYRFEKYKTKKKKKTKEVGIIPLDSSDIKNSLKNAKIICNAVCLTRDIANDSGGEATPTKIANLLTGIAKKHKLSLKVLGKEEIKKEGLNLFYSVAKGSEEEPKLVVLEYKGGDKKVALVGKGITFDSGGLSLKTSREMHEMRYDKSGAAAVIGVISACSGLKLPYHIIGLLPLTENLPSGKALKPGDIVTSFGKSVEIISTDAEGRLILADAISYSLKYEPDIIIDIATLTGACKVALSTYASGLFGNDEKLIKKMIIAGNKCGEKVWHLPLWEECEEEIKSDFADIKNVGGEFGGAISGAAFLKQFVKKKSWLHLDIAGTAWYNKDKGAMKGATGIGVRLITKFLMELSND
ncbi:MAG: leucyl aminopeptidase [Candidatus Thermoplasmatota archaeon]